MLYDCFNLFGHFKGLTTGFIIHGSPPCIIDMLVQYYTHLAWPINLHKFIQYTGKLLKNEESLYYLAFPNFFITLKVQLLGLLYMVALIPPWACFYNTTHTLPHSYN